MIEINKNMTEREQMEAYLQNRLESDMINEKFKEDDLEEYNEYLKEYKMPFTTFGKITKVKSIYFEVETDNGLEYFVITPGYHEGIWNFELVSEREVESIA